MPYTLPHGTDWLPKAVRTHSRSLSNLIAGSVLSALNAPLRAAAPKNRALIMVRIPPSSHHILAENKASAPETSAVAAFFPGR